jgi:hypothetical protein
VLTFLAELPIADPSAPDVLKDSSIIDHLLPLLELSRSPTSFHLEESITLACDTFSCLLHASLHSRIIWMGFSHHKETPILIQHLLLDDPRERLRDTIGTIVSSFCRISPGYAPSRHWLSRLC